MYEYRAVVTSVHDGDTVTVDIDLGFGIRVLQEKIRLTGIDAPELDCDGGKASRTALISKVLGNTLLIRTEKDRKEKWGRYLGTLILDGGINVNDWLVECGYAVRWVK